MSQRSNNKRKRTDFNRTKIPVITKDLTSDEFQDAFDTYKVVHLPLFLQQDTGNDNGICHSCCMDCMDEPNAKKDRITWKDLKDIFTELQEKDKQSWCIENGKQSKTVSVGDEKNNKEDVYAGALSFLNPEQKSKDDDFAYCSFLIQHDNRTKQEALSRFPLSTLPFVNTWTYGPSIWIFFGRNQFGTKDLQGRPEHTDSVSHDGTWHYQLSGIKRWYLRPTKKLVEHMRDKGAEYQLTESDTIQVDCNAGDVLIVNTALWWHQTMIPQQPDPSVSYARDFYLDPSKTNPADIEKDDGGMTNVDGIYASNDVEAGTIVFTEHDMPDGELHRSATAPNCEVVELEDGTNAVVTTKDVPCGDFFCLPESDSEADDDEETEED